MTPLLFVDHAPALGGAEHSLLLLLRRLDRARWGPHLACPGGPLAARAAALGVPVHVVALPRLRGPAGAPAAWVAGAAGLSRMARELSCGGGAAGRAVLIANTVRAAVYAAPAARLAGCPFVWYARDFWLSESRPHRLWPDRMGKRLLCRGAAAVIANSRAVAAGLPCPERVAVVHNGLEAAEYDPAESGQPFRAEWSIPAGAPLAGMAGRLRPWKGQERFLRAMAAVGRALPEARFAVIGGAIFAQGEGYPARLRALAAELGLAERVIFTGQLEDVRPALAALDVFVHPGDPEPFGRAVLEAMAMAKPVVGLRHGALPEIVIEGETGLLVPPGEGAGLAAAVAGLLRDPARRAALGCAGRARVEAHFSAERTAGLVAALLAQVTGRPGGGV